MHYGSLQDPGELQAVGLPNARGPLTRFLFDHLQEPAHPIPQGPDPTDDVLYGDDAALALYVLYELHYRGFADVDDRWEWEPSLLGFRRELEDRFEARVLEVAGQGLPCADVAAGLREVIRSAGGPSLSSYVAEQATLAQLREFAIHRSAYQLKEADPHTWAIPRLTGAAKAAMVEIQADEYGDGVERDMHQTLFGVTMRALGLDVRYGAYLDVLPGFTLATTNLVSFFGLHRRWRGALVGHLAVFEMTSVEPMGRYSLAMRRFGYGPVARHFYEVHVVADLHHEQVAADKLAAGLVAQDPRMAADVLLGARSIMAVEGNFSTNLLAAWAAGRTTLRQPVKGLGMAAVA
jgi:heme oxygenase-like protein